MHNSLYGSVLVALLVAVALPWVTVGADAVADEPDAVDPFQWRPPDSALWDAHPVPVDAKTAGGSVHVEAEPVHNPSSVDWKPEGSRGAVEIPPGRPVPMQAGQEEVSPGGWTDVTDDPASAEVRSREGFDDATDGCVGPRGDTQTVLVPHDPPIVYGPWVEDGSAAYWEQDPQAESAANTSFFKYAFVVVPLAVAADSQTSPTNPGPVGLQQDMRTVEPRSGWRRLLRNLLASLGVTRWIRSEDLLKQKTRRKIHACLQNLPGATAGELAVEIGVRRQTVIYHLRLLERGGLVRSKRTGRRLYYCKGNLERVPPPRSDTVRKLLHKLRKGPTTRGELARELDVTPQAVSWHLSRLLDAGTVTRVSGNRPHKYALGSFRDHGPKHPLGRPA